MAALAGALALGLVGRRAGSGRIRRRRRRRGEQGSALLRRAEPVVPEIDLMPSAVMRAPPMATYGSDEPRTKAAQVIQHRLMGEKQYQAVLALVEKYLHKFDVVNMVCAMHMCAVTARDHELLTRQIQSDPNFISLFHSAKEEILRDVSAVSPRTAADMLWSCARMSIFDSELFSAVIADATSRLEFFSAHGISLLVFALGYIGQRPRASFMQALVRELRARIDSDFEPQTLSMIVYGMMRLGIRDDRLMKIISDHLQRTGFDAWENLSVTCLAYAYTKLEYWDENTFALLGKRTVERLKELDTRQVVMVSLCFANSAAFLQLQESSTYTMDRITQGMLERLDEFDNRELATFCFAVGKYKQVATKDDMIKRATRQQTFTTPDAPDPVAAAFVEQVNSRNKVQWEMEMSEVNLITYSLMRMGYRDQEYLEKAAEQFARNAPELSGVEIGNALYAFARLEFLHLGFVSAMIEEIKRRGLLRNGEMTNEGIATMAYSLAVCRVREEEVMDEVASIVCERARDFSGQCISMMLWSLAVTNCRNHAEPLVSACIEDMVGRMGQFEPLSISIALWASAILAGPSSALRVLQVLFSQGFWSMNFNDQSYAMIYHVLASLQAEEGLAVQDLSCWLMCRRLYEESSGLGVGQQSQRLSERLRMQVIPHEASSMAPVLEGCREAGMRVDIAIDKLKLIIEVEGPQRMTIPLDKLLDKIQSEDSKALRDFSGRPEEVLSDARTLIECGLTGAAAFKRRLLRKCGWRVVTVSFDENEEYIADALEKMVDKPKGAVPEAPQAAEDSDNFGGAAAGRRADEAAQEAASRLAEGGGLSSRRLSFTDETVEEEASELSEREVRLRQRHAQALRELQRRIAQERGDAAASAKYSNHLEYRKWQVGIERQVFREMMAAL